jgi:transcriptional regulator with XRE-family HTH domain
MDLNTIPIPPRVLAGDFAGWLREAMAARRLTTRGLAARCGIDPSTICRLARGEREPSLATAVALLKVLATEPLHYPATAIQLDRGQLAGGGPAITT